MQVELKIKPLCSETWSAFDSLMQTDNQCKECWCLNHREPVGCPTGQAAKEKMKQLTTLSKVGNVLIEVEDECGGLSPNAEIDLFKPFEQQNKNRQGLGLGLNIARKAIELHCGTLCVRNRPDRGCVFTITLPKTGAK
jgi:hypothetical protein